MNSLHSLHEAFAELESRADAASGSVREARPPQRRTRRLIAPTAAAAAVLAAATGIVLVQHGRSTGTDGTGGHAKIAKLPAAASADRSSLSTAPAVFQPPATGEQLAERTSAILAGTATIHVTDYGRPVTVNLPPASTAPRRAPGSAPSVPVLTRAPNGSASASGAAIVGTLTSARGTGGFDLNVFATTSRTSRCDADTNCTVRTLADGSSLAVGSWHDASTPGGVTYQVELVRKDGADILIHLSTQRDPKGQSTVTSTELPLTVDQLIAFVSSDRW